MNILGIINKRNFNKNIKKYIDISDEIKKFISSLIIQMDELSSMIKI